jgi:hypothetical protein
VEHLDQRDHPEDDGHDPDEFTDVGVGIKFINGAHQIKEEAFMSLIVWDTSEPALEES